MRSIKSNYFWSRCGSLFAIALLMICALGARPMTHAQAGKYDLTFRGCFKGSGVATVNVHSTPNGKKYEVTIVFEGNLADRSDNPVAFRLSATPSPTEPGGFVGTTTLNGQSVRLTGRVDPHDPGDGFGTPNPDQPRLTASFTYGPNDAGRIIGFGTTAGPVNPGND